ncbi:MAG TPA: serine hydrolase domain-containing protein [Bryobacteraceae bacterium]|nr:serine hydrolase domain-containing protein [Bryobacteraceae bacterium]
MNSHTTRRDFGRYALSLASAAGASRLYSATNGPQALDEALRTGIQRRGIPAVAAMVTNGHQVVYSGAFGTRDAASNLPVSTNSIFSIASMTKAITTTAAMQLVEQGKLKLDEPASRHLPELGKVQVIAGFDTSTGEPKLRPPSKAVTLRHLLTHTSGFAYTAWHEAMFRYAQKTGTLTAPPITDPPSPLVFDPGTAWQYGTSLDWTSRLVEVASGKSFEDYLQENILKPLGMNDTSYYLRPEKFDRLVSLYQRQPDGKLRQNPRAMPAPPAMPTGGGGLYSTAPDYIRFTQMILGKGSLGGVKILKPDTVAQMSRNQIGALGAGKLKTYIPERSADVDLHPGVQDKWGFGFLINTVAYDGARSAGSLAWAGINNTFYWIDPHRGLAGVIMMQFLPFVDKEAVGMLSDFERSVYANLSGKA